MRTSRKGFTLLELLVTISIIGILVAVSVVSYSTVQKRGRDSKRRSDLRSWAEAMEQYYADTNSTYPADCSPGANYLPGGNPTDPKTAAYLSTSCTASTYCLCFQLESGGGNSISGANGACSGIGDGTTHFCVKNQQ